jgi:nitroreductase
METRGISPPLDGIYKERQVQLGKQIFHTLGIEKGDEQGLQDYYEKMYRFYEAPCIVVIAADRSLRISYVSLDVGLLTQTIALAAPAFGLGTCIMRAIVDYPETLKAIAGIPDSKRAIIGIAIGYPNWDDPLNRMQTERESLNKIVTVRE